MRNPAFGIFDRDPYDDPNWDRVHHDFPRIDRSYLFNIADNHGTYPELGPAPERPPRIPRKLKFWTTEKQSRMRADTLIRQLYEELYSDAFYDYNSDLFWLAAELEEMVRGPEPSMFVPWWAKP